MSADLARRWAALVADGRARWLPGMLALVSWTCDRLPWGPGDPVAEVGPTRVTSVSDGNPWGSYSRKDGKGGGWGNLDCYGHPPVPDFDDPATLGCLLALVRLAWGDPTACTCAFEGGTWGVDLGHERGGAFASSDYHTEVEALLAALEAAPKGAK